MCACGKNYKPSYNHSCKTEGNDAQNIACENQVYEWYFYNGELTEFELRLISFRMLNY